MTQPSRNGATIGVALGVISVAGLFVAARAWLTDIYASVGPSRSADITLLVTTVGCVALFGALGMFLAVAYVLTRISRSDGSTRSTTALQPVQMPQSARVTRLPAGNWAGDGNIAQLRAPQDVIELDFAGRPAVLVPRSAFYDALRMPQLRRADWRHDTNVYKAVRAYLMERGAIDAKGNWDDARREAIRRMAE